MSHILPVQDSPSLPDHLNPPDNAWVFAIAAVAHRRPSRALWEMVSDEYPVFTADQWAEWYEFFQPSIDDKACQMNPAAWEWLERPLNPGGIHLPYTQDERIALRNFMMDWEGTMKEGMQVFSNERKPWRSSNAWYQFFTHSSVKQEVEEMKKTRDAAQKKRELRKAKRKANPTAEDSAEPNKKARLDAWSDEDEATPSVSSSDSLRHREGSPILDLKLKEDSLGRIHPDNHKVMWAFGAETLSRHLPTLINGKIDHLLAIIKFTAEAGHNPSIDTFNDFFDQPKYRGIDLLQWSKIYFMHRAATEKSTDLLRDSLLNMGQTGEHPTFRS